MTEDLKKGDRVWVSGTDGFSTVDLVVHQVVVKSPGKADVVIDRPLPCTGFKIRLPRAKVFPTSEEAVQAIRDQLRAMASKLEKEALELRATADAVAKVFPAAE